MEPINIARQFTKILEQRLYSWPRLLQIVLGPRQVGKTTGVRQVFDRWQGPKHFASADTVLPPSTEWIVQQWNRARAATGDSLLVLDEIQKVSSWSEVVKGLFDEDRAAGKIKVVLLGSASLDLSRGLDDSLVGRFEIIPVPHWSARECRDSFNWNLEQFLKFGGYPGGAPLIEDPQRWQDFISNSVIDPVVNRDIPALQDIRKPALFRQVLELVLNYPAQEISFQKLLGQLQESGNVSTVKNYLRILSKAFLVRPLEKYPTRPISSKTSSPKIIPLCPALISAVAGPLRIDRDPAWRGRVLEACIGAQLLQSRGKLSYWRAGNREVDYVLEREGVVIGFEIKSNARKPVGGLNRFTASFKDALTFSLDEYAAEELLMAGDVDSYIENKFS